jgi:hypothetical protein
MGDGRRIMYILDYKKVINFSKIATLVGVQKPEVTFRQVRLFFSL